MLALPDGLGRWLHDLPLVGDFFLKALFAVWAALAMFTNVRFASVIIAMLASCRRQCLWQSILFFRQRRAKGMATFTRFVILIYDYISVAAFLIFFRFTARSTLLRKTVLPGFVSLSLVLHYVMIIWNTNPSKTCIGHFSFGRTHRFLESISHHRTQFDGTTFLASARRAT